jgi:hypothetical protein
VGVIGKISFFILNDRLRGSCCKKIQRNRFRKRFAKIDSQPALWRAVQNMSVLSMYRAELLELDNYCKQRG